MMLGREILAAYISIYVLSSGAVLIYLLGLDKYYISGAKIIPISGHI